MWYLDIHNILKLISFTLLLILIDSLSGSRLAKLRQLLLLGFSIFFLWSFSQKLTVFYLCYIFIHFLLCRGIVRANQGHKKALFLYGILFSLSLFFGLKLIDIHAFEVPSLFVITAVGISYNMLKAIDALYLAYYASVKIKLSHFAIYMLFIPTFTSGPVTRYRDFDRDLLRPQPLNPQVIESGTKRIILGFFKKIVVAELLAMLYSHLLSLPPDWKTSTLILLVYYLLLYMDFSGYSDIAIGFGRLLGFQIPENFKRPFSSPTLTQFWRNWHASLGDWFRDHIFLFVINRNKSKLAAGTTAFLVMLTIGLWHGLQPLFILWGIYHGILLFAENIFNLSTFNRKKLHTPLYYFRCLLVNLLAMFGTIFFSPDMQTMLKILKGFFR